MDVTDLPGVNKFLESSIPVVVVLAATLLVVGQASRWIIIELWKRIDSKDEWFRQSHSELVTIVKDNTKAMESLTAAIQRGGSSSH